MKNQDYYAGKGLTLPKPQDFILALHAVNIKSLQGVELSRSENELMFAEALRTCPSLRFNHRSAFSRFEATDEWLDKLAEEINKIKLLKFRLAIRSINVDIEGFEVAFSEYNTSLTLRRREFERDIEESYELSRFPMGTIRALHEKAWADGHSEGYYNVQLQYDGLVKLLETTLVKT